MSKWLLIFCLIALPVWAQSKDKICPPEEPIKDQQGWCHACDSLYALEVSAMECAKCKNREINASGQCVIITCPVDQPLQDKKGWCYDCARDYPIETSAENCKRCPNRQMNDNQCVKCKEGKCR